MHATQEIDRSEKPSLGACFERLEAIMKKLRGPGGCPWDREQTLATLKQYLLEETYEELDAIDSGDPARIRDELGDVLLQVVFQAEVAREQGGFELKDVVNGIADKLVRRHPHVFGEVEVADSAEVLRNWEQIKKTERADGPKSVVGHLPRSLPALHKAHQLQKKVSRVGFDWDRVDDVIAKIEEELEEVREALAEGDAAHVREEIGDLLFSVTNLSRFLGHDAEEALNRTVEKFVRRFQEVERRAHEAGRPLEACKLDELEGWWQQAKQGKGSP